MTSNQRLPNQQPLPKLEVWGGIECTVNRVGDRYFDQLERNGHATRMDDLDRFAALEIQAIRYPILWERVAPHGLEQADWQWADQRLLRLDDLGIRPIVGLVHHGSGPRETSLIDPAFPDKLAQFATAVAQRYPWVDSYTPVNEPLTTARFAGLYGHWYPHGRDDLSFAKALIHQCRATVLAMQAIRQINPRAQLVQTEDLGKILSTPLLAYQAEFENGRRWLSLDLLFGRVNADHPMWSYLQWIGVEADELLWFAENPCPPDLIGINRYVCGDRLIDERVHRYPPHTHGGNGKHQYADVEAVWVCAEGIYDHVSLLKDVWERYQTPIAITEAHLGCTREEQMRWLREVWQVAQTLRRDGVDFRAVTIWSLLGTYDWNTLVTREDGFYEPGVFDVRSPQPRPTALASLVQSFTKGQEYSHPVLDLPGWWQRSQRLRYPPVRFSTQAGGWVDAEPDQVVRSPEMKLTRTPGKAANASMRPLLITGATGTLGQAFARFCEIRGIPYHLLSRQELDITDKDSVDRGLAELRPWAVINATGYVRVDDAEREPHLCYRINTEGATLLAQACAERNIGMVKFSSDLVFDGNRAAPYVESHEVAPLNVYGQSKAIAEQQVLLAHPDALVIRTSAFFSPWDAYNFLTIALRTLEAGKPFVAASDAVVSPTYVPDLVNVTLDLLIDGESGLWHLANAGASAWADLARDVATLAGLDSTQVHALPARDLNWVAVRPAYSALGSERGILMPPLDKAIARYLHERICA
ncbi:family 1 glycosylhydrolase [Leptolyngbya sp. AN02str]|uniref:family 1 glycosylhydrolase n=1 Tax=Leptolyngbya sp. AN02str TaxID=3423363 RepID=UPI003D313E44